MPKHIKAIGIFGNALLALCFGVFTLIAFSRTLGIEVLFFVLVVALAAFNIHVFRKSARLLAEEEWLKAEVRKLELREKIKHMKEALGRKGHADDGQRTRSD